MYGFSICRMQRAYGGSPLVKSASNVFDKTLVSAVERGDLQEVRHLIRSGSSPSVTDDQVSFISFLPATPTFYK